MRKLKFKVVFKAEKNYRIVKFSDTIKRPLYAFQVRDDSGKWHSLERIGDIGFLANFLVKSGNASDYEHALSVLKS